jgi:methionine synthase reductase
VTINSIHFYCDFTRVLLQIQALEPYSIIVFITSTTGDGDPPDASLPFFRALRRHQSENKKCSFRYCLLGLGDSNYSKFCRSTKDLDSILQSLGATRVCDTVLADDATGFVLVCSNFQFQSLTCRVCDLCRMEDTVSKWSTGIFPILQSALSKSNDSSASVDPTPSTSAPPPPECIVMYGSQTGNATEIAKTVAESMRSKVRCQLSVMSDIDLSTEMSKWSQFNRFPLLVFVTSTTGDGDPPDNARKFLRGLKMIPIDNNPLMHIKYAILGILIVQIFCVLSSTRIQY